METDKWINRQMDKQANKWITRQTVKNTMDKKYPDTH
jgi:hypothetical protein